MTVVMVLSAASGVAAALAPGAPTGIALWDVVVKFLLGAVVVLAGSTASWPYLAVGAVATLVGSAGGAAMLPAAAALGATVRSIGPARRRSKDPEEKPRPADLFTVVYGSVAAVVCQVALRLTYPHVDLVPSAIAAVAVLAVLVGGLRSATVRAHRWMRWSVLVGVLVAVALSVVAAASILVARSSLEEALTVTHIGLAAAVHGDQGTARNDFATAESQFDAAYGDLAAARVAEIVPGVAQQVRAVNTAASIGERLSNAAVHTAVNANASSLHLTNGVFPIEQLVRLGPLFKADLAVIASCIGATSSFRSPWVVSPLKSRLVSEVAKLHEAQTAATTAELAVQVVPGMLGQNGVRRYLLLFENPAESRASGGVVGDYAVATAFKGKLTLGKVSSVGTLDHAGNRIRHLIGPASYVGRYSRFQPEYTWENVPMSPDFPSVAQVAANLFPQSGGSKVDAVISIDPETLAGLLKVTGPVVVPGWTQEITPDNVIFELVAGEFVHFQGANNARVAYVQALIKQIWHDLVNRSLPPLGTLARDVAPAERLGHLHMWSQRPSEERLFDTFHVSGRLPPVRSDFLGVVTQNAEGNKIDTYLRRTIQYRAAINDRTGGLSATLRVTLHNTAPSSGLPTMILDPSPGVSTTPGESYLYVSVYSPWLEQSATLDGKSFTLTRQQELGRYVYSGFVTVPSEATATLLVHLAGRLPHRGTGYHLTVYNQPVIFPDHVTTSLVRTK